jgi:hypothetical protein
MTGVNPDAPTDPLADVPETVDGARLVGVDGTGVPVYFDETDDRVFEGLESDGEWVVGEERTNADLAAVVDEIAQVTGWTALADLGAAVGEE